MSDTKPLEKLIPVKICDSGPCKGCEMGFEREEYEGRMWHVWEGAAYLCTNSPHPCGGTAQ